MQFVQNANAGFTVQNVICWTKQGSSFIVGGSFSTVNGIPSQQLQASTNTTLGYFNGQMLANSVGNGTGIYAGQVAGALINFDPASDDDGQAVWNGLIIADAGFIVPLAINTTYTGSIQVAAPNSGWTMREQFLYASGTPATDVSIVNTAITSTSGILCTRSQTMNSSNSTEVVFSY